MDVINDEGYGQWLAIEQEYKVPQYVYDHEPLSKQAADTLPDSLFADVVHRMFPVSSPADTWMSAAYFNENKHSIKSADLKGYVEQVIKSAAGQWKISEDVEDVLCKRAVEVLDPESDDGSYCLVMHDQDGRTVKRSYPVYDVPGLKKACAYFTANRSKYPLETRVKIAMGIVKKAEQLGEEVPMMVRSEAMDAVPYRPFLMQELYERTLLTKDAEAAIVIGTLVEMLNFAGSDELIKSAEDIVNTLSDLDNLNGLDKYYGTKLLSPNEVVFSMSVKQAETVAADSVTLSTLTFSATKLASLDPALFKEALGDDFVAEISDGGRLDARKMADVLPTLPRPEKMLLERAIVGACQ